MSVISLVSSGPLLLAIPVAAAAGAVTFLSPCCLPLVPGYLAYITGMSGADATAVPAELAAEGAAAGGAAGGGTKLTGLGEEILGLYRRIEQTSQDASKTELSRLAFMVQANAPKRRKGRGGKR